MQACLSSKFLAMVSAACLVAFEAWVAMQPGRTVPGGHKSLNKHGTDRSAILHTLNARTFFRTPCTLRSFVAFAFAFSSTYIMQLRCCLSSHAVPGSPPLTYLHTMDKPIGFGDLIILVQIWSNRCIPLSDQYDNMLSLRRAFLSRAHSRRDTACCCRVPKQI